MNEISGNAETNERKKIACCVIGCVTPVLVLAGLFWCFSRFVTEAEMPPLPARSVPLRFAVSPDERFWAFDGGSEWFWLVDSNTGEKRRLWLGAGDKWDGVRELAFSPDGKRVAVSAWSKKKVKSADLVTLSRLLVCDASGGGVVKVTAPPLRAEDLDASFSPDGAYLTFVRYPSGYKVPWRDTKSTLCVVSLKDRKVVKVWDGGKMSMKLPRFTPDGKEIVFVGIRYVNDVVGYASTFYVVDAKPGSEPRQLCELPKEEGYDLWAWDYGFTADGKLVVFALRTGQHRARAFLVDRASGRVEERSWLCPSGFVGQLGLSRDGNGVYFVRKDREGSPSFWFKNGRWRERELVAPGQW